MLDLLNRYAHGFVTIPVILACRDKGFFDLLRDRGPLTAAQMVDVLGANSGHLQAALRLMQSLGWLAYHDQTETYTLTSDAELHTQIPEDIRDMYQLSVEAYLLDETHPERLGLWLERSYHRWHIDQPRLADFLDGMLVVPLLLSLKKNNLLVDNNQQPLFSKLTPTASKELTDLFVDRGWAEQQDEGSVLTDMGRFVVDRSLILGTTASYRPMLAQMAELLFGDCRAVLARDKAGDERHLDRSLNVVASGFQHEKYFAEVEMIILSIFNQLPFETQPRYVADMGCGDGSLLKRVYETILKSARGQVLAQYPIRMIGVDYNQAALDIATQTLVDIPHLVLSGDIGNPQQLVIDLQAHDIDDPEHILHLRSFLDHNRPFIPPANVAATEVRSPFSSTSLHVDAEGQLIPPHIAVQSLVEHLERWTSIITHHGLLTLEVHSLEPDVVRRYLDQCENLHFDAYHAFSQQYLVEADVFLLAAAEAGLFAKPGFGRRYPRVLPFTRITLTYFEKRPYSIRYARLTDLPSLIELETACWPEALRTPAADLQVRLEQFSDSQLVLELEQQVVGVVYFQPIAHPAILPNISFEQVAGLRTKGGHTIQLLALNVLPRIQHLGLGDQLLEFVLDWCTLKSGIETVVGVTRCQNYGDNAAMPLKTYIEQRDEQGRRLDPILKFHEAHGATIKGVVAQYRPEDEANHGHGILIEYDLDRRRHPLTEDSAHPSTTQSQSNPPPKTNIAQIVEDCVTKIIGRPNFAFDHTRPVREMGLDSLDLMELRLLLGQRLDTQIDPTFFFHNGTPEAMVRYFQEQMFSAGPAMPEIESVPSLLTPEQAAETDRKKRMDGDDAIAIIGLACRFPGGVTSPQEFWTLLQTGTDAITDVPASRWNLSRQQGLSNESAPIFPQYGGFVEEIDRFDAPFFHISPREAEVMDPKQRILLEESWHALEQAGIDPTALRESQTGVFVGILGHDYELLQVKQHQPVEAYFGSGNSNSVAAGRIAYALGLQGPAMAVNTACSSSLVAVHLAVQSLRNGECDLALAAGVNLILSSELSQTFARAGMLAPDGRCKTFDASANGYVRSEGCGVVVLKRLSAAVADRDNILAVIRGSAVNQDGASNGLTAPNGLAQESLLRKALQTARIEPHEISYVEAHGTGTMLGDPIEVKALGNVYGAVRTADNPLTVGSVKTNIGHTEAAAGIAGLIKVVLSLQHGQIPPHLHFAQPNPYISWDAFPLVVPTDVTPWPAPAGGRRIAGVSSFGFSGTNAHLIIEDYQAPSGAGSKEQGVGAGPQLIVLSAKTEARLRAYAQKLLAFLEASADVSLTEMAYTLQVGRAAMDARLALVVTTQAELRDKLIHYLENKSDLPGVYQGYLKAKNQQFDILTEGEEATAFVKSFIRRGELTKLAQLWVAGLEIEWNLLYGHGKPRRVSLPTYPFAKERYWLPGNEELRMKNEEFTNAPLHQLVHRNTSTLTEQRYSSSFKGTEFFLRDHLVQGEKMLPGVAYLEMARAAGALAVDNERITQIKDVVWLKPLVVKDEPLVVRVGLYPDERDEIAFEVSSEQQERVVHSQGTLAVREPDNRAPLDIAAIQSRCRSTIEGEACYRRFEIQGLVYGSTFRGLERLSYNEQEALARLQLPAGMELAGYGLHPSLLDAALQAVVGLSLSHSEVESMDLSVPFAVQAVTLYSPLPAEAYAYVTYSAPVELGTAGVTYDIALTDEQGAICVTLNGLTLRAFTEPDENHLLYSTPVWQLKPLADGDAAPSATPAPGTLLLIGWEPELVENLATTFHQGKVITLEPDDVTALVQASWRQLKAIIDQKPQTARPILVVAPDTVDPYIYAPLVGLIKTVRLEQPHLRGKVITVAHSERDHLLTLLSQELQPDSFREVEIRYDETGARAVKILRELELTASERKLTLRAGGAYWITGGLGELGRIFARHLLEQAKNITVILSGRSALDEAGQKYLADLNRTNGTVVYLPADVSLKADVEQAVQTITEQYGPLRGIIHSAGVIKDSFILNKTESEIEAVLAPKVTGLLNIDEATRNEKLDFVVLFSSIAGVLGNIGQADYAAANAFLDGFAHHRQSLVEAGQRSGRTLSIDWPLWIEGGMTVDDQSWTLMARQTGLRPLSTATGLRAFETLMASTESQVLVAVGAVDRLRGRWLVEQLRPVDASPSLKDKAGDTNWLVGTVQADLVKAVSRILKIRVEDIAGDENLSEYGFDSITLTELANQLNNTYDLDLLPTVFFEHNTLTSLGRYLAEHHTVTLGQHYQVQAETRPAPAFVAPSSKPLVKARFRSAVNPHGSSDDQAAQPEAVAIIGMSGVLPGSPNLDTFWQHLVTGKDLITETPPERWDWRARYGDPSSDLSKTQVKWGGFIDDVDKFDAAFFKISPREAMLMDPQQRLWLQTVWHCIEDAGYAAGTLAGTRTGIFVGAATNDYQALLRTHLGNLQAHTATGLSHSVLANRISYLLDLHGPSEPIDTACSSSLVAIHRAVEALHSGSCELAIAGGVNVLLTPDWHITFSLAGMLAEDGRCKTFDQRANGYVRSEGVGAIFLKPLAQAEADGDHIYAVIRATAENHGGRATSLTAPNPKAQADLLVSAYQQANLDPATVGYIEAHGTGTALGDPIEVNGLKQAFARLYQQWDQAVPAQPHCGLGSVKTNIGHLEAAAGIAGVLKVLLALQHQTLPANINFEAQNPYIDLADSPFYVVTKTQAWPPSLGEAGQPLPRRAGVSSFGFGGANAHVVLEEHQRVREVGTGEQRVDEGPQVIVLSAKNEERLRAYARRLLTYLKANSSVSLTEIAYTLQVGREAMDSRLALVVSNVEELVARLNQYQQRQITIEGVYSGTAQISNLNSALLIGGNAGKAFIKVAMDERDFDRLAQLWVLGVEIDWTLLYSSQTPRRISLPTYPFAKKRYWFDGRPTEKNQPQRGTGATVSSSQSANLTQVPLPRTSHNHQVVLAALDDNSLPDQQREIPAPLEPLRLVEPIQEVDEPADEIAARSDKASGIVEADPIIPPESAVLEQQLRQQLVDILYIEPNEIDGQEKFVDFGLDSITGVEWVKRINRDFGLNLNATRLYDYPTLQRLAKYLAEMVTQDSARTDWSNVPASRLLPTPTLTHEQEVKDVTDTQEAVWTGPDPDTELTLREERSRSNQPVLTEVAEADKHSSGDGIAIIGIAGRFPGARNVDELWCNLAAGIDSIAEVSSDRWQVECYYDPDRQAPDKSYSKWLGALADIDKFDPLFFNISPREAELMDPQQRLFLEEAWNALEDAGYAGHALAERKCGVFVGASAGDYHSWLNPHHAEADAHTLLGSSPSILAARLAYILNLKGASLAIDTACSSSLVAIHEGCQSLLSGQNEMVLAGGVCVLTGPQMHVMTSKAQMLAGDGRCKTFDQRADGFGIAEGVGVVVLKRLAEAVRDGDQIYGVIKGSGLNQDGATNGITAPSVASQTSLELEVYRRAGIDPATISLVEAHGTGTKLGDPIEVEALTTSFRAYTEKAGYCALGSVKTNIGHTLTAAGVAGVIKVLLALKHKQLPPSLHFEQPNEHIDFANTPFYVNTKLKDWEVETGPRRAAVSSFGFSGTNAHLVLEEYQELGIREQGGRENGPHLIVLSARNEEQLKAYVQKLLVFLEKAPDMVLAKMAYTLQIGREAMASRLALIVSDISSLHEKLTAYLAGEASISQCYQGQVKQTLTHLLSDEEDRQVLIRHWQTKGKLEKLAVGWVKGLEFEWSLLYETGKPGRTSLPTYPFARERYWLSNNGQLTIDVLHPLVHRNISDLAKQCFSTVFTGDEFFLMDHRVQGEKILPGVVSLEMARAAGQLAVKGQTVSHLKDVVWLRPFVVGNEPLEVQIGLYLEESGEIAFEVSSSGLVHSQGKLVVGRRSAPEPLDIGAIQARCRSTVEREECYRRFETQGLVYGPAFQGLTQLNYNEQEVLARLRLPARVETVGFGLHPSMLDAALQATIGLASSQVDQGLPLPFAVQAVNIYGELAEEGYAYVKYSAGVEPDDAVLTYDITLTDRQGIVAVEIQGFSVRTAVEPSQAGLLYGTPDWQVNALGEDNPATNEAQAASTLLLVGWEQAAVEAIKAAFDQAEVVELDPADPTALLQKCWPHLKIIVQQKDRTRHPVLVVAADTVEPHRYALLTGLLKSARLEQPNVRGKVVTVSNPDTSGLMALLHQEMRPDSFHAVEVRYDQTGTRQIKTLRELELTAPEKRSYLKPGGVYWLTGGLGGLGRILARHLLERGDNITLILSGRSVLDETGQQQMTELKKLGETVVYLPVDVSLKAEVEAAVQTITQQYGPLNGIIHSAGVIKDSLIINKTEAEIEAVLAPKVTGILNVDAAVQAEPLDFMVLFSSMAGILGNVGQADYAAANAFLDAFAHYRQTLVENGERAGRTLAINWPLWAEGGMAVDESAAAWLQHEMGLTPLETSVGLTAFDTGLTQAEMTQLLVSSGDQRKIRAYLKQMGQDRAVAPDETSALTAAQKEHLVPATERYLKECLSETLKLSVARIEPDDPWEKYGLDSIMVLNLTRQLEQHFGELPKTLFFEYQTLTALTGYFVTTYPIRLQKILGLGAEPAPAADLSLNSPRQRWLQRTTSAVVGSIAASSETDAIAIVGLSGRFPLAENLTEFWQNLQTGRDCITEIPPDRWDWRRYHEIDELKPDQVISKWGGFINDVDKFDPLFFNISPREAELMDPQERLFLEIAWQTLEDAGYTRRTLYEQYQGRVGVFVGVMWGEYQLYSQDQFSLSSSYASIANRVSYYLNLHGPSLAVDTMCSSSLTSIHLACESIKRGECAAALAGGVNISIHPNKYRQLVQGNFAASDGHCRSFGEGGDGYVPGEGVGAVLLKPLAQAEADGDQIYGVIIGSSINHGGKTNGYTVPNPIAQGRLIAETLHKSGVRPESISYVEAHGTGTALGDPIEIRGMSQAWGEGLPSEHTCVIGSVKSNIGHLESAAGIAGLTKVLLQMKHSQLVPSLHSERLNPHIDFEATPFRVQRELTDWAQPVVEIDGVRTEYPRRAGISSFGAGGANAHLLVEEYQGIGGRHQEAETGPQMIVLSAMNEERLTDYVKKILAFLEEKSDVSLAQMAYTLQVGREAMTCRLVLVVNDITGLRDKLTAYLAGEAAIEQCYRGQVKQEQDDITLLSDDDDDSRALIGQWLAKGKLEKVAAGWVKGLTIDWMLLYGAAKPRRISLPTYPFARQSYWVPKMSGGAPAQMGLREKGLHPLLDSNESTLGAQVFRKTLSRDELVLRDHRVNGVTLLPGVAHLEMARAAVERAAQRPVSGLREVMWGRPLILDGETKEVFIEVWPEADAIGYAIYSQAGDQRLTFSQGKAICDPDPGSARQPQFYDLTEIKNRCVTRQTKEVIYSMLGQIGFDYGPSFQVTEEIWANEQEGLSRLKIPETLVNDFGDYSLHPSLMDGALRALIGIGLTEASNRLPMLQVPFGLERLEIFHPLEATCYAYARTRAAGSKTEVGDVSILNEAGQELVRLSGFVSRPFVHEKAVDKTTGDLLYYRPVWQPTEPLDRRSQGAKYVVLFDNQDTIGELLQAELKQQGGGTVIRVSAGQTYQILGPDHYQINAEQAADYEQLFKDLRSQGYSPMHIVHLWSRFSNSDCEPVDNLSEGLYSIVYLTQAITKLMPEEKVWCLYGFSVENGQIRPESDMVAGLARSLITVNHRFELVTLNLSASLKAYEIADILSRELRARVRGGTEIRYQASDRLERKIVKLEVGVESAEEPIPIKPNGVYMISGGAGGLGLIFANYLVEQYQARLILIGRSELTGTKAAQIRKLKSEGAEIIYLPADIADINALEAALKQAKATFGSIDGVLHSAGIEAKTAFMAADRLSFEETLRAKVQGTLNLDQVTRDEPLSFFLLFSSLSALVGDFGHGSYAAGNRFLDGFAVARERLRQRGQRSGQTVAINWPYWADGRVGQDSTDYDDGFKRLYVDYTGLRALTIDEGLKAFEAIRRFKAEQIIVAVGEVEKVDQVLRVGQIRSRSPQPASAQASPEQPEVPQDDMVAKTEAYLIQKLSETIKLSPYEIRRDELLAAYGVDSVMMMEMNSLLSRQFPALPATLLFEYDTIEKLARYFIENHGQTLAGVLKFKPQTAIQATRQKVKPTGYRLPNKTGRPAPQFQYAVGAANRDGTSADVAIIGLSGRYPQAQNLAEFWQNLKVGRNCITEIPQERWDHTLYYDADKDHVGRTACKWGGFIDGYDRFDPLFFNISPREAEWMDPQARLFLEITWETVEDAGYTREQLKKQAQTSGREVGVYVGVMHHDYPFITTDTEVASLLALSNTFALIANRVSHYFDFQGPSIVVDTACSSSLTAITMACDSIRRQECDLALAGGVNLSLHPAKWLAYSQSQLLGSEGKSKSLGDGDGYLPGEGVGAVLLKRLDQAIADNDQIYAVIKGGSLNHAGKTAGLSTPNPNAQAELIRRTFVKTEIEPQTISYVEVAANGSAWGDPIEITGLSQAFQTSSKDQQQRWPIGSVKSNIGHLEAASGISQLTKVILQLKHQTLVPSINADPVNPNLQLERTPFYIQKEAQSWLRPEIEQDGARLEVPRRAAISSFGAGGANAHLVVEEAPFVKNESGRSVLSNIEGIKNEGKKIHPSSLLPPPYLFVLSAKNEERLRVYATKLLAFLENEADISLVELAYTLQVGREAMEERLAVVVRDQDDLKAGLAAYRQNANEEAQPISFFKGNSEESKQEATILASGRAGQEIVKHAIADKDWEKLAVLWTKGVDIPWEQLYGEDRPRRISIPTYPFERQRYWLIDRAGTGSPPARTATVEKPVTFEVNLSQTAEENIRDYLGRLLSKMLKISVEEIKPGKAFYNYGIDSIMGIQIRRQLEATFEIEITGREMLEYGTLRSLAHFLATKIDGNTPTQSRTANKTVFDPEIEALEKFRNDEMSLKEIKALFQL